MIAKIKELIQESIETKKQFLTEGNLEDVSSLSNIMIDSLQNGGKIISCGNGGSASDSLHFAAELLGRFQIDRPSIAAISLNADISTMTAIANDMGFEKIFSRQVDALGKEGDVLFVLSTSGNSHNLGEAVRSAKKKGIRCTGLLGRDGGELKGLLDTSVVVCSKKSARIQEVHITLIHILCEIIEDYFFAKKKA
jgi:D-sedoheptulose 7-phosphate isomerase